MGIKILIWIGILVIILAAEVGLLILYYHRPKKLDTEFASRIISDTFIRLIVVFVLFVILGIDMCLGMK